MKDLLVLKIVKINLYEKKMLTKSLKGKDYISLMDYSREELETILEVAMDLKKKLALGEPHEYLKNKTLGMIFANPSTRTRTSFEAAMTQLGGHAQFHTPEVMQIAHHETWIDTAKVLDRYIDGPMSVVYDEAENRLHTEKAILALAIR